MMNSCTPEKPNYFELFGLKFQFNIDEKALHERYIRLQAQFHPDTFANKTDLEKRIAIEMSTEINEAYQTLKQPISRALYLTKCQGVEFHENKTFESDSDFLLQQLQLREELEELKTKPNDLGLHEFSNELKKILESYFQTLEQHFTDQHRISDENLEKILYEVQFFSKLSDEIKAIPNPT